MLVGGASSRMGADKARLPVGGVPGATRVSRLLTGLFVETLLVGGRPPDDAPGRRVSDGAGPVCALRGLVAALEATTKPRLLVAATDLPLLTPELVLALVAWPTAEAVAPKTERGPQPLCALYDVDAVLPVARRRFAAGELMLRGLLDAVETAYLAPSDLAEVDPTGRALVNLNTRQDLLAVEAQLARG